MTYNVAREFPNEIIFAEKGPLVSIYLPTHRQLPERRQDIVLFRQLVKDAEKNMGTEYPPTECGKISKFLAEIENDKNFWDNTREGLAVLASPDKCVVYLLDSKVDALAIAADSFHIKPLVSAFQKIEDYQILAISGKEYSVYQGNKYGIDEIDLGPDVPKTIDEILGPLHTEKYTTQGTYGASGGAALHTGGGHAGNGGAFVHGQGSKKDDVKQDLENFYRNVDKLVHENVSMKSGLPLILANLHERQSMFMKIAKNPYLVSEAVDYSYDTQDLEGLNKKALALIEPLYKEKNKALAEKYAEAKAKGMGADKIEEVAKAIAEAKVAVVMIEEGKVISGKVLDDLGNVELYEGGKHGADDLLDDFVELVIRQKGDVVIMTKEEMPTDTGVAVIYRF